MDLLNNSNLRISNPLEFSGAAHDAVYLSRIAPTAMIFVACEGGIGHNEIENARPEHLEAGAKVLLGAVLQAANAVGSR